MTSVPRQAAGIIYQQAPAKGRQSARGAPGSYTRIAPRLRAELRTVRAQGYAFDDREFHDDMRCVAVPVFEKRATPPAGISISGPTSRFTLARLKHLRRETANEAEELSRKFGGSG